MADKTPKSRRLKKSDIKVTIHMPDDLEPIRQVWTQYYVNYAADLLNKSSLPLEYKHKLVDELVEYCKNYKKEHKATPDSVA